MPAVVACALLLLHAGLAPGVGYFARPRLGQTPVIHPVLRMPCLRLRGGTSLSFAHNESSASPSLPAFMGRVYDSATGQVLHEMSNGWPATGQQHAQDCEDTLQQLELRQKQQQLGDAESHRGPLPHLPSSGACTVCTGPTTETTQCPRCFPGKPAVHKICEDEWLLRKKVCIFCRLPVRRTSSKELASDPAGMGAGSAPGGSGAVFSYRSPRNKMFSARLAALRTQASAGRCTGAEAREIDRRAAAQEYKSAQNQAQRVRLSAALHSHGAGVGEAAGKRAQGVVQAPSSGGACGRAGTKTGKMSNTEAKVKLKALYNKYRGYKAQHALDDVSLSSLLDFAARLFTRGHVLPPWIIDILHRLLASAHLMEGRCIAQSLTSLTALGLGGVHPSHSGVPGSSPLDAADIARLRLARMEREDDAHTGDGGKEAAGCAVEGTDAARKMEEEEEEEDTGQREGTRGVQGLGSVVDGAGGDDNSRGKDDLAQEQRAQVLGGVRAKEAAQAVGRKLVARLSARGAEAHIVGTFSGEGICDALTALGRLRQGRDNPLLASLCLGLAQAPTNPLLRNLAAKRIADLAEALCCVSPAAADGARAAGTDDMHVDAGSGSASIGASAGPVSTETWRQALGRVADALCAKGKMDRMDAQQLARTAASFARLSFKHDWLLVRLAGRVMSPQVTEHIKATEISTIASAFASLRHADPALFHALAGAALRRDILLTLKSSDARVILESYAALGVRHEGLRVALVPISVSAAGSDARSKHAGMAAAMQALADEAAVGYADRTARDAARGQQAAGDPRFPKPEDHAIEKA